ncbi:hypothetical protein KDH_67850 [Dictyobacter sp. S3.2.2.5]|uniref:Uncharacterized protein n=1 Tax=Dictyobacter halimunensis TaxID=3026934 RepID=A0ABQ6G0D6_9CHLR|nr:hypothetical protein KDH_67850 [Dictyobacter sp. S3.2.2.5]
MLRVAPDFCACGPGAFPAFGGEEEREREVGDTPNPGRRARRLLHLSPTAARERKEKARGLPLKPRQEGSPPPAPLAYGGAGKRREGQGTPLKPRQEGSPPSCTSHIDMLSSRQECYNAGRMAEMFDEERSIWKASQGYHW